MLRSAIISSSRKCQCLLHPAACNLAQVRTTVIVERYYKVGLAKKGKDPRLQRRHMVYKLVENTLDKKISDIECILSANVEGLGSKGDRVKVKRSVFHNKLLAADQAVYVTPENIEEYCTDKAAKEAEGVTAFAKLTQRLLEGMYLRIPMSGDNSWTINATHLRVAFRMQAVHVEESCIKLPPSPVTEPGEIEFTVTINNVLPAKVKGMVYLVYKDETKNVLPTMPSKFSVTSPNRLALRKQKAATTVQKSQT